MINRDIFLSGLKSAITLLSYLVLMFLENAHLGNLNLFEGDMILTPEQRRAALQGGDVDRLLERGSVVNKRWPGGVMVYTIDSSLGDYLSLVCEIVIPDSN